MRIIVLIIILMIASPAYSESIVDIARSQIGKGEIGGDNRGPEVREYTRGQEVPWCAAFVSWVRFRAGQRDNYTLSARSYWEIYRKQRVLSPRKGDIIIFKRGKYQGHVGIVEKVSGTTITTIEGNVGKYPAKVKRCQYTIGKIKNLLGFIRI